MGTRVLRIPDPEAPERAGVTRLLDPAGTALMFAVSASVLVASLLVASLSAGPGQVRAAMAGAQPGRAHPQVPATPAPEGAPTSP